MIDKNNSRKERMLKCTLKYADLGWCVIPLWSVGEDGKCLCGKENCGSPGKHPYGKLVPNGLKDSTTDKSVIASWFKKNEELNIAICTGPQSGIVALDVDPDDGGEDSLAKIIAEQGELPQTPKANTGGGGCHYIFKYPDGKVRNSASKIADGLDIRGQGGYIVAPPSLHASGNEYRWAVGPGVGLAECPAWLKNGSIQKEKPSHIAVGETIPKGKRDVTLISIAGSLRRKGLSADEMLPTLHKINENRCKPPLGPSQVIKIAESAAKYEPGPNAGVFSDGGDMPYCADGHGLVWLKPTKNGPVPAPLTNFTAKIINDVVWDDGAESSQMLDIQAKLGDSVIQFTIPASQFSSMNWPLEHLGASAVVYAGYGAKDHARVAIQMLSGDIPRRRVYTHTGWRKIGDTWAYLHAGGAIGSNGSTESVEVSLNNGLDKYHLIQHEDVAELIRAVKASLKVLEVVPHHVGYPLFCVIWRSILGQCDLSLHLSGPTGTGKSELAALIQQHFGLEMNARHLPAHWMSTANALEGLAFSIKDAVIVVDDFAPAGTSYDVQRLHRKAGYIFRAQGNHAGRQRMRADTTLRAAKPPRGLVLSTGEDIPKGQSVRARILIIEVSPKDVKWSKITSCQQDARSGLYSKAVYGFVKWLAARYESAKSGLPGKIAELRQKAVTKLAHKRTPETIANLVIGMDYFTSFAQEIGAISASEAENLKEECWKTLDKVALTQALYQTASEPTVRFLELISSALACGRAHLASQSGEKPENPEAWGWRTLTGRAEQFEAGEWKAQGSRIGWIDGNELYLDPDASYGVAVDQIKGSSEGLSITAQTLRKRLKEGGYINLEAGRESLKVRRTLEGRQHEVLHLTQKAKSLLGEEPDKPDTSSTDFIPGKKIRSCDF